MYGCESWNVKLSIELWCWKRLMRVPWTAISNQSILKETNPEYSSEGLILKLKLQYFGHLMQRVDFLEKTLMLGKTEVMRRRGWQDEMVGWHQRLNGHEFDKALTKLWGKSGVLQSMGSQRVRHDWATELNTTLTTVNTVPWIFIYVYTCFSKTNLGSYCTEFHSLLFWVSLVL